MPRIWLVSALAALAVLASFGPSKAAQIRQYCAITTNVATVCSASPVTFLAVVANNSSAMLVTLTCYDNASAASGQVLFGPATMGANQTIAPFFSFGATTLNGLTCIASGSPGGNGFLVVFTGPGGP